MITTEDIKDLADRATLLEGSMGHSQAVNLAINEAIGFGWLTRADSYGAASLVSTEMTNRAMNVAR